MIYLPCEEVHCVTHFYFNQPMDVAPQAKHFLLSNITIKWPDIQHAYVADKPPCLTGHLSPFVPVESLIMQSPVTTCSLAQMSWIIMQGSFKQSTEQLLGWCSQKISPEHAHSLKKQTNPSLLFNALNRVLHPWTKFMAAGKVHANRS